MLVRVAFAVGRLPWELTLTPQQEAYLLACDAAGLVPNPYDVAWRLGHCMVSKSFRFDEFVPLTYGTRQEKEEREKVQLTRNAKSIAENVRL